MFLAGPSVGFGIASTHAAMKRIEYIQALLYRFAERKLQMPHRAKGALPKEILQAIWCPLG